MIPSTRLTDDESTGAATTGTDEPDDTEQPPSTDGEPPIELTPTLCDDPGNLDLITPYLDDGEDPSYGEVNSAQVERMLAAPTAGPFYMVNLIRFRDQAVYRDGRDTDLTGREANALYSPVEFLDAIGARVFFFGEVGETTAGDVGAWDEVAIVEYPCPLALFALGVHPAFEERSIHKDAGLEKSIVLVTHARAVNQPGMVETPFPSTAGDPAFKHVQAFGVRDQAVYPAGSDQPARTGPEAMAEYEAAMVEAQAAVGITPDFRFVVEGAYIGDGRDWDAVWIDSVPSTAAFNALAQEPDVAAAELHRDAAVEDSYGVGVAPLIAGSETTPPSQR